MLSFCCGSRTIPCIFWSNMQGFVHWVMAVVLLWLLLVADDVQ